MSGQVTGSRTARLARYIGLVTKSPSENVRRAQRPPTESRVWLSRMWGRVLTGAAWLTGFLLRACEIREKKRRRKKEREQYGTMVQVVCIGVGKDNKLSDSGQFVLHSQKLS